MERASNNAEQNSPGWRDEAMGFLKRYLLISPSKLIIAPEVRRWAEQNGCSDPPHKRAWGGVFSNAKRAGLITMEGFQVYGDAEMHSQTVRQWRIA